MNPQLYILSQLVRKDLTLFFRGFKDKFIDLVITLALNVIVFAYFMPTTDAMYGTFILVGAIASFGFFETVGKVAQLVADIDGDRTINFKFILPVAPWAVLCAQAVAWALESAIIGVLLFPLGKLILFSRFSLAGICFFKLAAILVVTNLFYGFFALWVTSMLKGGVSSLSHLWVRYISPLYMFGCYFYPWSSAYAIAPIIGYLNILNPMTHIMEGTRSAVLGAAGFLPFWGSFCAVALFAIAFGAHAIKRLKMRLDCV